MPVPPPKNPECPNFGVGMPHARSGGDALSIRDPDVRWNMGLKRLVFSN